jgi:hypothetical protein
LGRPANAAKVAASLRATSEVRLVFLCSPGDTEQILACEETGEEVMVVGWDPGRADFARKTNLGFRETSEEWVFLGADDLVFTQGWDVEAVKTGDKKNAGVVGTQDNGNPMVKKGLRSTHSLVRRTYIEVCGGSLDGPGSVYSEVYDHQWVDCELVDVAKARGEWAFAKNSVVEHNHPHWRKAEMDDTYRKATRESREDMLLFQRRMKALRRGRARPARHAAL